MKRDHGVPDVPGTSGAMDKAVVGASPLLDTLRVNLREYSLQAEREPELFVWPTPPYYEWGRAVAARAKSPEQCLLVFKDGTKAVGRLVNFLPDEEVLRFKAGDSGSDIGVAFSSLLRVRLLQPAELRYHGLPESVSSQQVASPPERQPFHITFENGESWRGETMGSVHALCGLFLYVPEQESDVARWFIPARAMREINMGPPIGQMLVSRDVVSADAVDGALRRQQELRQQKLGEYLTENQIVSSAQLMEALKRQRASPALKLGESLMSLGFLTKAEQEEALAALSRNREMPIGKILTDMGIVNPDVIAAAMASKFGVPYVNLEKFNVSPEALDKVPASIAERFRVVPLCIADGALVLATEAPNDIASLDDIRFAAGMKLVPVMASAADIRAAIARHYGASGRSATGRPGAVDIDERALAVPRAADVGINELTSRLASESRDQDQAEQQIEHSDSTLVRLVNKIILDAVEQKVSDIHIESNSGRQGTRIRFRKDGTLIDYLELQSRFRRAIISRIKIMSQLDITERRKPQDGKIEFGRFGPADVELRVATVPTRDGLEDMVLRVLGSASPVPVAELGFDPEVLGALTRLISKPQGLFLVCGPTGSGKTTTLHSLLGFINTSQRKIWTAEDPIEITQPGLRQVQVNAKIGWTFAVAMRSFLRADPDVIMVGEMRDAETTKVGIEASLTGHLVLSTLHTNSATECVTRLLDLGMDPFNFSDALLGVLAQRLAKRLCPRCKVARTATREELHELAQEYCLDSAVDPAACIEGWLGRHADATSGVVLYSAGACDDCNRTGYSGRMGLYELLVADARIKRLVQSRAPMTDLKSAAAALGMRTLKQDGIERVLQGLTDMHQVRAVCG